jgi:homoserine kinase
VSELVTEPVSVRVPATSANLGPGFDSLGLALALYDVFTGSVDADGLVVEVEGQGAATVPRDERHLVVRAAREGFAALGVEPRGLRLRCVNAVPHGRGLGSSSSAIVGGLVLARGLVVEGPARLPDEELFALAARIEGHPDNVAPAVFGGLTVAWSEPAGPAGAPASEAVRLRVDPTVHAVAFVPPEPLSTAVARGLLPTAVPHGDASANAGRAALLVAALTGQVTSAVDEALLAGTADRLHQAYRAPAMPDSAALVARLRSHGVAAFISGAGPTVLALLRSPDPGDPAVESAIERVVGLAQPFPGWQVLRLEVDGSGAAVLLDRA